MLFPKPANEKAFPYNEKSFHFHLEYAILKVHPTGGGGGRSL